MPETDRHSPVAVQEAAYRLPYHWFPEKRLRKFEREEKQRIIFDLVESHRQAPILRYLAVGCGDGRWATDIHDYLATSSERSLKTVGIDVSERAIGFARLITPYVSYSLQDAAAIACPRNCFDLITAIEVIEHIEHEAEQLVVREMHRVLHPDGLLVVTVPSQRLKMTEHHFRHYSVGQLRRLLEANGFELLDIRGQSLPCYGLRRRIRRRMARTPKVWRLWRCTYRATDPHKGLNIMIAARPRPSG
jgi:SAM-dependent methyltransferase